MKMKTSSHEDSRYHFTVSKDFFPSELAILHIAPKRFLRVCVVTCGLIAIMTQLMNCLSSSGWVWMGRLAQPARTYSIMKSACWSAPASELPPSPPSSSPSGTSSKNPTQSCAPEKYVPVVLLLTFKSVSLFHRADIQLHLMDVKKELVLSCFVTKEDLLFSQYIQTRLGKTASSFVRGSLLKQACIYFLVSDLLLLALSGNVCL